MTWAELVKHTMDTMLDTGAETDDELEKMLYQMMGEKSREHFNTISLARIASALYKLAGINDEITDDNVLEVFKNE